MILDSGIKKVEQSSLRSFKDCPNHCKDGYVIDPYRHSRVECPYCAKLRRDLVRGTVSVDTSIQKQLNLPASFTGDRFNTDYLWPKSELALFEEKSLDEVKTGLNDLYVNVAGGVLPSYSILINLGRRSHTSAFAYPFLVQAYKGSMVTAPYVTDYDIRQLYNDKPCTIEGLELSTLLSAGVCLINILASATTDSILACKGLMQLRARSDKVTLFLTDYFGNGLNGLFSDEKCKDLAFMLSVQYKRTEKEQPKSSRTKSPEMPAGSYGKLPEMPEEQYNKIPEMPLEEFIKMTRGI